MLPAAASVITAAISTFESCLNDCIAVFGLPLRTMSLIRRTVSSWRWPFLTRRRVFGPYLNTMTLSPRVWRTTSALTAAPSTTGRPIEASSTVHNFVATNANDNNVATYWEGAGNSYPNTLTVNLGANATISSVVVRLNPDPIWGRRTQGIEVAGS